LAGMKATRRSFFGFLGAAGAVPFLGRHIKATPDPLPVYGTESMIKGATTLDAFCFSTNRPPVVGDVVIIRCGFEAWRIRVTREPVAPWRHITGVWHRYQIHGDIL